MKVLKMIDPPRNDQEVKQEISQEQIDRIKNAIKKHMDETGISQSRLAKQLGFSPSTLSQFLSSSYKGDVENVYITTRKFLNLQKQKIEAPQRPNFVMTEIADEIMTVLAFTQINNDMGAYVGDPGIGKSMTCKKFKDDNPNVVYISISPATKSPIALLDEMLDALDKQESGTSAVKQRALIKELKNTGKMFIIDEAHHLTAMSINTIQAIYDAAETPIFLTGNPLVLDQMGNGRIAEFAQFFSRIGIHRKFTGKKPIKDIIKIASQNIIEPNEKIISFLSDKANGPGGYRYMVKHLVLAQTFAGKKGSTVDIKYLQMAERMLEGE